MKILKSHSIGPDNDEQNVLIPKPVLCATPKLFGSKQVFIVHEALLLSLHMKLDFFHC